MASAATTSNKNGLTARHHIALDHDLIIVVENYEISKDSKNRKTILCVHEFEVASAVLREHRSFRLPSSDGKQELKMRERDLEALKVLLQMLHGCIDQANPNVSILTIWYVLEILRKHSVDPACPEMKGWYAAWYDKHESRINITQCRELLTPSYFFDHAEAFAAVSLMLAINASRHIEERMPEGFNPGHSDTAYRTTASSVSAGVSSSKCSITDQAARGGQWRAAASNPSCFPACTSPFRAC